MLNNDTNEGLLRLQNGPKRSRVEGYSLEFHGLRLVTSFTASGD